MPIPEEELNERRIVTMERIASLEQLARQCSETGVDYRTFKESMIAQLATLKAEFNALNWKVGSIIGLVVVVGNFLIQLGLGKMFGVH
jgi:hypothetical protein